MTSKSRLCALLCVLVLFVCALATYPVAEMGIVDDWSYVRSAQVLARSGHVVYNGWATEMLGWQLCLGALFARLFGPSFTAIRASTLVMALATSYLTQRTFVRAGLNTRNATIGTLALVLSPLFMPLAVTFMSDVGGLFFMVLCLYACLRALEAVSDRAMLGWLTFAALANALGGTVRQIAWLGVLVMFPCTVWLLRRRPKAVLPGVGLYAVSGAIIFGAMRWFSHQPYSVPEALTRKLVGVHHVRLFLGNAVGLFLGTAVFLLPVLIAFVRGVSFRDKRVVRLLGLAGAACVAAGFLVYRGHRLDLALAPYLPDFVSSRGMMDAMVLKGDRPVILGMDLRVAVTVVMLFALICFAGSLLWVRNGTTGQTGVRKVADGEMEWRVGGYRLIMLLLPFTLAYLALLTPRSISMGLLDRYLLPLVFVGIVALVRLFQDRVAMRLPIESVVLVAVLGIYGIAGTHDAFSWYRARRAAVDELRAAGVKDTAFDAGFEANGLTQIEQVGYVNDPRIRVPATVYISQVSPFPADCQPQEFLRTPVLVPGYALSFNPAVCGGASGFAPVTYGEWLGPRRVTLYVVKTGEGGGR